jgi:hypothetical protein
MRAERVIDRCVLCLAGVFALGFAVYVGVAVVAPDSVAGPGSWAWMEGGVR